MKLSSSVFTLLALSASANADSHLRTHANGGRELQSCSSDSDCDFGKCTLRASCEVHVDKISNALDAQSMMPLTQEKMLLIAHAAVYSKLVYDESMWEGKHGPGSIAISTDEIEIDAVGFKETEHHCFVVFRGTDPEVGGHEWLQNFNAFESEVKGCKVHAGFRGAGTVLHEKTKAFIEQCMPGTGEQLKQLILTGHSQGAGAAGVASILYSEYNPLTIGFAQPTFLKEDCGLLNPEHNWRITNTENGMANIKYDLVAFIAASYTADMAVGPSIGPLMVLPPNDNGEKPEEITISPLQAGVYVRPSSDPEPWMGLDSIDGDFTTHYMTTHRDKILYLLSQIPDGGHLETSGFIGGTLCDINEECKADCVRSIDSLLLIKKCSSGEVGSPCGLDGHCLSEHCDWSGTCQPKLDNGLTCAEHETCKSGYCSNRLSCSDKSDGSSCNLDGDCNSLYCSNGFKCLAKLGLGQTCGEHDTCLSGYCSNRLSCSDKSDGSSCNIDGDCNSLYCSNGFKCLAKLGLGATCGEHDTCASGYCSNRLSCSDKSNGSSCNIDGDCNSLYCSNGFKCEAKLGLGKTCGEHDTCASGYCSNRFSCSDKSNGSSCNIDGDCNSRRCTWNFKCESKLSSGAGCGSVNHSDSDCASGQCSYSWSRGWRCE